jgi:hypothetical protein
VSGVAIPAPFAVADRHAGTTRRQSGTTTAVNHGYWFRCLRRGSAQNHAIAMHVVRRRVTGSWVCERYALVAAHLNLRRRGLPIDLARRISSDKHHDLLF